MTTRPMLDRVRQAVFNIIGAAYGDPGSLPAVAVLDIFAGSGALGIEALSRGAAFCCFVEDNSAAGKTLLGNLKTLGLEKRSRVLRESALHVRVPPPSLASDGSSSTYTIVFLDPPYPISRDSSVPSVTGQLLVNLPAARLSDLPAWLPDEWKRRQAARPDSPIPA
jgi:16S rRNA (guanine966-N2)-methyltransferase